ncbi:hypothetical protein KP78_12630 [Jeotgalibacillus soli]|uniref:Uncharacterized protein n=1 Tax=Jeotgalibacillus soli TaxID=889306 RepID=A0A0C2RHZ9_9BACL|nr:hypothetical protein KP78_12630 [Jeotgalibacillus soli]
MSESITKVYKILLLSKSRQWRHFHRRFIDQFLYLHVIGSFFLKNGV